jgi:hypothetical protein
MMRQGEEYGKRVGIERRMARRVSIDNIVFSLIFKYFFGREFMFMKYFIAMTIPVDDSTKIRRMIWLK